MANYFDPIRKVMKGGIWFTDDNCPELEVNMCRVDGGKLWRFLKNINLTDDAADTVMRDYFNINTYGKPLDEIAKVHAVIDKSVTLFPGENPADVLKRITHSNCYAGTIDHLLQLMDEAATSPSRTMHDLTTMPWVCYALLEKGVQSDRMVEYLTSLFGKTTQLSDDEIRKVLKG